MIPTEHNEEFYLRLRPLTGPGWRTAPAQRLKLALKRLGRDYGLRCIECRPETPDDTHAKPQ